MKTKIYALVVMTLALGSFAWSVQMPERINSDRDLKIALKAARTPEDHQRIADYSAAKAEQLDREALGYEHAAQSLRNNPLPKNLAAPNTAARYEVTAKEFREEAASNRQLAAANQKMAQSVIRASK